MLEAFLLLIISLILGSLLGIFMLKPFVSRIESRNQMLYIAAIIVCFFGIGTAALYLALGAPVLVSSLETYRESIPAK